MYVTITMCTVLVRLIQTSFALIPYSTCAYHLGTVLDPFEVHRTFQGV